MTTYSRKFRLKSPFKDNQKPLWKSFDTIRILISVGYGRHEGERLHETLLWAKEHFKHVHLFINDTLQKYNFQFEDQLSAEAAYRIAKRSGEAWFINNREHINVPGIHTHFWDDFIDHTEYKVLLAKVEELYESIPEFKKILMDRSHNTFERRKQSQPDRYNETSYDQFMTLSQAFYLEETAGFALAFRDIPGISAYEGNFMEIWNLFIDNPDPNIPQGLKNSHWAELKISSRNPRDARIEV